MSAKFKSYLGDAIRNLVTHSNIDSWKSFIEEQSDLIKDLTAKISTVNKKLNSTEVSIDTLNGKINNLEWKLACFESQDEFKSRKIDDLEQYECQKSLRFSGFEVKENESKEVCEHVIKSFIRYTLNVDMKESEYNRIHRIGPKIKIFLTNCC